MIISLLLPILFLETHYQAFELLSLSVEPLLFNNMLLLSHKLSNLSLWSIKLCNFLKKFKPMLKNFSFVYKKFHVIYILL